MTSVAAAGRRIDPASLSFYRLTVAQYHAMIEAGILTEDDRCELLRGWIVAKMPPNPPHATTVTRLGRRLIRLLPDEWPVRVQCPITLRDSEPEPDVAVVRGPEEAYRTRHPAARDVALAIEVAESSLDQDREVKGPLYAGERIPIYWIVNLVASWIEVYSDPKGGRSPGYRRRQDYGVGQSVPLVLGNRVVAHLPVRELLP
jgi:Uma2 family endonuclease